MKFKLLTLTLTLILAATAFAQTPKAINYQGIARDGSDALIANKTISLRISILSGSSTGTNVYSETFSASTNKFGLFTLQVGTGSTISGTFSTINWSTGNYYLKTEMDASGGTNYSVLGTSQLISVPYAFYADNAGVTDSGPTIAISNIGLSGDSIIYRVTYTSTVGLVEATAPKVYIQMTPDSTHTGTWSYISLLTPVPIPGAKSYTVTFKYDPVANKFSPYRPSFVEAQDLKGITTYKLLK